MYNDILIYFDCQAQFRLLIAFRIFLYFFTEMFDTILAFYTTLIILFNFISIFDKNIFLNIFNIFLEFNLSFGYN